MTQAGGPLAFVFPGQGSQFVGMGRQAYEQESVARRVFDEADEALGFSLSGLCFEGAEEDLRRTENTQPAILAASVAMYRVLESRGTRPHQVAGHSLGEYSALVAAGSLDLATAVRLVRDRGRYMQGAVPEGQGAMAAILGLDDETIISVCTRVAGEMNRVCSPANFNAPGQVVIAGHTDAVERAVQVTRESGARRAKLLNVSAPFHCALMTPAAERMAPELAAVSFRAPAVPVTCNVDATVHGEGKRIAVALERQITAPVRWVASVRAMAAAGAERWVEVGPGKVLGGLIKRIIKPSVIHAVGEPADVEGLMSAIDG